LGGLPICSVGSDFSSCDSNLGNSGRFFGCWDRFVGRRGFWGGFEGVSGCWDNFIFSFGDRNKYMAVVVQRLERTVVVRKTRVRLSPSASLQSESNRITK
jgi:hypothetical protein